MFSAYLLLLESLKGKPFWEKPAAKWLEYLKIKERRKFDQHLPRISAIQQFPQDFSEHSQKASNKRNLGKKKGKQI